jgi:hypothetical protein
VARATSPGTKEKRKIRKARKEDSSSKEELSRVYTLEEDSNLGKD